MAKEMRQDSRILLEQYIQKEYRFVLLKFNSQSKLEFCDGHTDYFAIDCGKHINHSAEEILPFMVGVDVSTEFKFHYVEFIEGIVCNVYLYPDDSGFHIIMVDTGFQHDLQQDVQQQSNENSILQYRLQQMDARLQSINQRLEKANRAKSEFISTASHELKTPLSSILGYAEIIQNQSRVNVEVKSSADIILSNGHYLLSLLDNLLEQGRIEYNQTAISRHPTNVTDLLMDVMNIVQPLADKKSLQLKMKSLDDENIALLLDEQHIRQVLINILTNAIKYTEQGEISLTLAYTNEILSFSIHDTGIGIKPNELTEILLPFRQAEANTSLDGVGLGLSVSKKLVQLMGGDIDIQSSSGDGTVVSFSVPALESDRKIEVSGFTENHKSEILIIDDDDDLCNLFRYTLEEEGYPVISAGSRDSALKVLEQQKPDIILLDHNLDGEDGVELALTITSDGFDGKIIMMTAASDQKLVDRAIAAGCIEFLHKPIKQQHLLELLDLHGYKL